MLNLASDADVHGAVTSALAAHPGLNFVRVQDLPELPEGALDPQVLEWAAGKSRILLTNDRATMIKHAQERVTARQPMPGLIVLPPHKWIGVAISDVQLIAAICDPEELDGRIVFLPLKPCDLPGRITR